MNTKTLNERAGLKAGRTHTDTASAHYDSPVDWRAESEHAWTLQDKIRELQRELESMKRRPEMKETADRLGYLSALLLEELEDIDDFYNDIAVRGELLLELAKMPTGYLSEIVKNNVPF